MTGKLLLSDLNIKASFNKKAFLNLFQEIKELSFSNKQKIAA